MRIAIIGDLQYHLCDRENIAREMAKIASLRPDFALFMGDHSGQFIGSLAGLRDLRTLLGSLGCPYHAILGNHDVECPPQRYFENAPLAEYRAVFGCDPWRADVVDGVLLLFVTVERQPLETMRTVNAVYVGDWQFRWIEDQLRVHPGMPTVIFTHAPAAGYGTRCAPPLHCSSVDTYLDQTFEALRWRELPRRFPQIKAWFSAHLHLGHDYDTAIDLRGGVAHVSCGVMHKPRDGQRHTRFMELSSDKKLTLFTLDHDRADAILRKDAVIDLSGREAPSGRVSLVPEGEMLLGKSEGVRFVRYSRVLDRYYISTEKGFLWEYDPELAEFGGTLTYGGGCADLRFDGARLSVTADEGGVFSVDPHSRGRFDVLGGFASQEKLDESAPRGEAPDDVPFTTRDSKEGLWVRFM